MNTISQKTDKIVNLTIINTNARSLCLEIDSLVDCLNETDSHLAVVTETWLRDGESLEEDVEDLVQGTGLGMLYKNREACPNGVSMEDEHS